MSRNPSLKVNEFYFVKLLHGSDDACFGGLSIGVKVTFSERSGDIVSSARTKESLRYDAK